MMMITLLKKHCKLGPQLLPPDQLPPSHVCVCFDDDDIYGKDDDSNDDDDTVGCLEKM